MSYFIQDIFNLINNLFYSTWLLLPLFSASLLVKIFIFSTLLFKKSDSLKTEIPYRFLITVLFLSIIGDIEWIFTLLQMLIQGPIFFFVFWRRLAWASGIAFYNVLTLFLESLVEPKYPSKWLNKTLFIISMLCSSIFILFAIFHYDCVGPDQKHWVELLLQRASLTYALLILMPKGVITIFWKLKTLKLPKILKKQLRLLMQWVIVPLWISDIIQVSPLVFNSTIPWFNTNYTFVGLSTILINLTLLYCSRRMLGLRFLNWNNHVQAPINLNFMDNLQTILEQFSQVTTLQELGHITQRFFKEAFEVPFNRVQLHIRSKKQPYTHAEVYVPKSTSNAENYMDTFSPEVCSYIKQQKILVYDELAFSNYYESDPASQAALAFLDTIQADIFLPMYEKDTLIAYITVDRFARPKEFYTKAEYDEMIIFSRYLGNIIHLMQQRGFDTIIKKERELQQELYSKHQEINQYKESVRSFLRNHSHKEIGILFYKNRQFTFANKAATQLIRINPNIQEGHPLSKALRSVAQHVITYKSPHKLYAKGVDGTKLILSGVLSLENNSVIISMCYPEITDVIKKQIDLLKDPSEWDYLLYLETTQSGQLINQLIPGTGETLLNFKVELLKTALSTKAIVLDMPEQDLQATVQLLHHISLRETLHTIALEQPINHPDVAITLFGMNALLTVSKEQSTPLLEKLDTNGTLFIKNIHNLDRESQEYLAEFIRYGLFRIFKSDTKVASNVRIICSTTQHLYTLVQEGKFSNALYDELKYTTLSMPSLTTLPVDELANLAQGFSEQAVTNETYQTLLSLSERDKHILTKQRPASLQELKTKVQQLLVLKSKHTNIHHETSFDMGYHISDPELVDAARLGKRALKDQKIMALLWQKFKNQNQIASFLGVNRSSVNRRCRQYNLISD